MASYERRFFYKKEAAPISSPFQYSQSFNEVVILSETMTKSTDKSLSENITLAETFNKVVTKSFNETVILAETFAKAAAKSLSEIISIVETFSKTIAKSLKETITIVDTLTLLWNSISAGIPDLVSGAIRSILDEKPKGGTRSDKGVMNIKSDKPTGV